MLGKVTQERCDTLFDFAKKLNNDGLVMFRKIEGSSLTAYFHTLRLSQTKWHKQCDPDFQLNFNALSDGLLGFAHRFAAFMTLPCC